MNTRHRHAILGIAFNSNDMQIFPFLKSLEQTGFKGDLILFINNKTARTSIVGYAYDIKYVNVDKDRRSIRNCLRGKSPFHSRLSGLFYANTSLGVSRFVFYYNWLIRHDYDRVFCTDTDGVLFQDDVFRAHLYGSVLADDSFIHCSGAILGSRDGCLALLRDLVAELPAGKKDYSGGSKNEEIILTLAEYPRSEIMISGDNIALRESARHPAVINQYKGHKDLIEFVRNKFI